MMSNHLVSQIPMVIPSIPGNLGIDSVVLP
jgi:hypothetical protein